MTEAFAYGRFVDIQRVSLVKTKACCITRGLQLAHHICRECGPDGRHSSLETRLLVETHNNPDQLERRHASLLDR